MTLLIRDYCEGDTADMRRSMVELQEFERGIDSRLRPGETIADEYCAQIHARCREADGRVFVAEYDGAVVGFVGVLAREQFTALDEPPGTYALITDLVVLERYRKPGHRTAFARTGRGIRASRGCVGASHRRTDAECRGTAAVPPQRLRSTPADPGETVVSLDPG